MTNKNKIKVKPEGRDGVWIADKASVVEFLNNYEDNQIHNYLPASFMMLGTYMSKADAIRQVKDAERLAILTGDSLTHNLRHALAVIIDGRLSMFDIGEIKESDLLITE